MPAAACGCVRNRLIGLDFISPARIGADARQGLIDQVSNPVRWADSVRCLASLGVERFIEVGAGGVLTGMLRGIDASLKGVKFGEAPDLANF